VGKIFKNTYKRFYIYATEYRHTYLNITFGGKRGFFKQNHFLRRSRLCNNLCYSYVLQFSLFCRS